MDVTVKKGGFSQALKGNLIMPDVSDCFTIVYTYKSGFRCGGFVALFPKSDQLTLGEILDKFLMMKIPDSLLIIGDIAKWDENWKNITQANQLKPIQKISDINKALGIPDIDTIIHDVGEEAHDVHFMQNGLYQLKRSVWVGDKET